jgi:hypothetical protein
MIKKGYLVGGLITKGIKAAAKKYFKMSGKTITDLTKSQPLKSRTSAKTDYARALQLHSSDKKDKMKLQQYIRKQR